MSTLQVSLQIATLILMTVHSTKYKVQRGQALVLVLLSLAVVLTIVLFILARSITDVAVSSRSEAAVRAFSAAEAGIENALVIGTGSGGQNITIGNASYNSNVTGFAEGTTDFVYPIPMYSGDSMTTWFVSHDAAGNTECTDGKCFKGTQMSVCWGKPGTDQNSGTTPAIEASIFYEVTPGSLATIQIARITADPNSGRVVTNKFGGTDGACNSISGGSYAFQKTINFAGLGIPAGSYNTVNGLQFARVRMLYNTDTAHPLAVTVAGSGGTLPSQGQDIVSTGTAGDSNRKVQVFQGWPEPPQVFDYAIYSGTGLTK